MLFQISLLTFKKFKNGERGFTLLEILVAITILSFIFGVVYASFSSISDSDKRIHSSNEIAVKARNLMEYMVKDISSAFYPRATGVVKNREDTLAYGFTSDSREGTPRLNFTAIISDFNYRGDKKVAELGYYLSPVEGRGYSLIKRVDETPDGNIMDGGYSEELMRDISSLSFEFLRSKDEWIEEWNVAGSPIITSGLPKAIIIKLGLLDDSGEEKTFSIQIPINSGRVI